MKDYKLSEVKSECKRNKTCKKCKFFIMTKRGDKVFGLCEILDKTPTFWNIEVENGKEN